MLQDACQRIPLTEIRSNSAVGPGCRNAGAACLPGLVSKAATHRTVAGIRQIDAGRDARHAMERVPRPSWH